ncbi:hypothetical protein N5853_12400 [Bartonella sp. HY329]|uniref:hypothetical protein n=1 Tax=unclassified Bartonella TaxID=2645622 RepID=UPI0021C71D4A|nr:MULTISPECIES: hypothetical protein [unclassified Bartonella]UXM94871.1 hypothetical protein N5853_12400 [Bartonella sp. HY329]UXN09194.1 hypothetical protein N5852_12410 [Bartonella sp. HY328]
MKVFKEYLLVFFIYIVIGPLIGTLPFIVFFSVVPLLSFSLEGIALFFITMISALCVGYIIGGPVAFLAVCLKFYSMNTGKLNEVTRFLIMLVGCFLLVLGGAHFKYHAEYAFFLACVFCLPYCLLSMFAAFSCDSLIQKIKKRLKRKASVGRVTCVKR